MGNSLTTTSQLAGLQYRLPYTQRDFAALMDAIRQKIPQNVPEWSDLQDSNYGMTLLGTVAALVDWISFYGDRAAAEAYVLTCIGKSSISSILQLLNYQTRNAVAAYTMLRVSIASPSSSDILLPIYTEFSDTSGSNRFVTTVASTISAGDLYADIPARQGTWQTDNFTSDGSAQQRLILSRTDIADGFIRVWVGQEEWAQTVDNTFAGVENWQKLFRVLTTCQNTLGNQESVPAFSPETVVTQIEFGDGLEGFIPPVGMNIRVSYLTTLGDSIRIPAGAVNQAVSQIFDAIGNQAQVNVVNTESASGGDSAESLYRARKSYPQQFRTMRRAVTTYDFKVFAAGYPGVLLSKVYDVASNAESDDNLTPDRPIPVERAVPFYQARVYVIPRNDWTSEALNDSLQAWLQERCAVDKDVVVLSPSQVGVDISVVLRVYSSFQAQGVKYEVVQAIQGYFLLSTNGDIQIGSPFYSSRLITVLQQIPGVASLDIVIGVVGQSPSQDLFPQFDEVLQLHSVKVTIPLS